MLIGNYSVLTKSPGRFFSGSAAQGANQAQARANWSKTGPLRGAHYQDGDVTAKTMWGIPDGAYCCYAILMPYLQGEMASRYEAVLTLAPMATGVMGYPLSGSSALSISVADASVLPEDDSSPLRTATASISMEAEGTGELKSSGSGAALFSIAAASSELVGILSAVGSSEMSVTTNTPILGAEASGIGVAEMSVTAGASILPIDDSAPARTATTIISMFGALVPYAIGSMVGSTVEGDKGTLTADQVATEVIAALHATTIPVDSRKIAGVTVGGSGTASDPWGPL